MSASLSQRGCVGSQIRCARHVWKQGQQLCTSASVSSLRAVLSGCREGCQIADCGPLCRHSPSAPATHRCEPQRRFKRHSAALEISSRELVGRVKRSTHQTCTIEMRAGLSQGRWARIAMPLSTLKDMLAVGGHGHVFCNTSLGDQRCNSKPCECPYLRCNCN